jgi:hypothetical protein
VIGSKDMFIWGVWASISKASYDRIGELWDVQIREHELPKSGELCSDIPIYPPTGRLRCTLYLQNAGRRPSIKIEPADHPLAIEQRNGITIERVKQIAALVQKHSK